MGGHAQKCQACIHGCGASSHDLWSLCVALAQGIRERGTEPVAKLTLLQNKCLRSITGACKAPKVEVLEAEAGMISDAIRDICTKKYCSQGIPRDALKSSVKQRRQYEENCAVKGEEGSRQKLPQWLSRMHGSKAAWTHHR